jgi:hypothetical protein
MSDFVIYTAIFGPIRDKLFTPYPDPQVKYVAFVDSWPGQPPEGWQLRPSVFGDVLGPNIDPRRKARQHKCLAHELFPRAKYSLWVDGCLTPKQDLAKLIERLGANDIATFEHMDRNCVYQELEACLKLRKDKPQLMRAQIDRYREEGYPYNNGLAETTAVLRRHTDQVTEFNKAWWYEIEFGSVRDQLSMDYVCWKLGLKYSHLAGTRVKSPHFNWRPHR